MTSDEELDKVREIFGRAVIVGESHSGIVTTSEQVYSLTMTGMRDLGWIPTGIYVRNGQVMCYWEKTK